MSDTLLSSRIKEETKQAHQELEKIVIMQLKAIRSNADYADFLNRFYIYFNAVEQEIKKYINDKVLSDYDQRRNSSYLKLDVEELGFDTRQSVEVSTPKISGIAEALGAMYVLEGSIMGGPIIVEMLKKYGITKGFSFFSGYGSETGKMWSNFINVLNENASETLKADEAVQAANQTFDKFKQVFEY